MVLALLSALYLHRDPPPLPPPTRCIALLTSCSEQIRMWDKVLDINAERSDHIAQSGEPAGGYEHDVADACPGRGWVHYPRSLHFSQPLKVAVLYCVVLYCTVLCCSLRMLETWVGTQPTGKSGLTLINFRVLDAWYWDTVMMRTRREVSKRESDVFRNGVAVKLTMLDGYCEGCSYSAATTKRSSSYIQVPYVDILLRGLVLVLVLCCWLGVTFVSCTWWVRS